MGANLHLCSRGLARVIVKRFSVCSHERLRVSFLSRR